MKIELKNFNYFASGSEETVAFTATVYVDNERTFLASNSGKGEAHRIQPVSGKSQSDIKRVQEWIEAQPDVYDDDLGKSLSDDLDFYLSRLVDRELLKRDLKKLIKKRIVLYDPNSKTTGFVQMASHYKPDKLSVFREKLIRLLPDGLILNDLDFEQALEIYAASNSLSKMADVYRKIKAVA